MRTMNTRTGNAVNNVFDKKRHLVIFKVMSVLFSQTCYAMGDY